MKITFWKSIKCIGDSEAIYKESQQQSFHSDTFIYVVDDRDTHQRNQQHKKNSFLKLQRKKFNLFDYKKNPVIKNVHRRHQLGWK